MRNDGCRKTILVADKREGMCAMMRFMLAQFGAQAVTATNADQALALAGQHESAIAFIDLELARGNALALTRQLHRLDPEMTIVIMYAYATKEELACMRDRDDILLLPKPFELSDVREIVRGRCGA